ncbi:MAG TPA: adenylate/guanylate cyclase domain-containing protein [Stellaceae bacterium]|nr:adenylate/guanylate cyclase domain-containing protein [Stellaceae bacterium]
MPDENSPLCPKSPEEWLAEARRAEREGELFRACDIAMQGLAEHPDAPRLKHRAILCLASTGATRQAIEKFAALDLDKAARGTCSANLRLEIANLKARLAKDDALARAGEERRERLREAADLYQAAYAEECAAGNPEAYYPGVNAATLRLLAGDRQRAMELAGAVLEHLASWPEERRGYYELATEIEALLILGRPDEARRRAGAVRRRFAAPDGIDFRALAGTLRQLRLVIDANRLDAGVLAQLTPPHTVHYLGHIIAAPGGSGRFPAAEEPRIAAAIESRIAGAGIGFGYGSLAAGADILFAEALLRHGANLNIVLPFDRAEFIDVSVRPAGNGWVERFETCFAAAEAHGTVRFATQDHYLGDDALFGYCSQLAMGLAILRARHLCTEVEQIAVWDGNPPSGPVGTAVDMANWRRTGRPQSVIRCGDSAPPQIAAVRSAEQPARRRTRAMLFGDIHGFSTLSDAELPRFVDTVLAAFAKVIDGYGDDVLLANTWGDGLYLVFDDAGRAAHCALDLQQAMTALDLAAAGLPDYLALRLGGHLGPVYASRDPILKQQNFFGAHVSRAARIEPVTPEGCVYVTETLAAVLAIHNTEEFTCDYVGMTEAAKHYGRMRMFLLRRTTPL